MRNYVSTTIGQIVDNLIDHSNELNIEMNDYFIGGFSAGGHAVWGIAINTLAVGLVDEMIDFAKK